jgi:quinol monooxygenase YgiN
MTAAARPRSRQQTSNFFPAPGLRQMAQPRRGPYGVQGQAMPETSEVIVVAEVRAKAGQADALRAVLLAAVAPSRQEAGNNVYRLHEDKQRPGNFLFYENWKSQEAIDEHMRTPHFKALVAQAEPLAEPLSITLLDALSD